MSNEERKYRSVSFKREFLDQVDAFVDCIPEYRGSVEFICEATRIHMNTTRERQQNQPSRFERINADPTGIKIFDRKLTGERLVHVTISPHGIICDFHGSSTCEHVEYTLQQPDVQEIIKEKKKEGWKLP